MQVSDKFSTILIYFEVLTYVKPIPLSILVSCFIMVYISLCLAISGYVGLSNTNPEQRIGVFECHRECEAIIVKM